MAEMGTSWRIVGPELGQAAACEAILRTLPEWFGIEESLVHYVDEAERLPTFRAVDGPGNTLGFISVKRHTIMVKKL